MRIDVSEPKQCVCVTCIHHRTPWMLNSQEEECGCFNCIQHRTSPIFNTRETEPSNVIGTSFTSVPVSSGLAFAFCGASPALAPTSTSSPVSSGTATATPLAPPVTTSVDSEPAKQSIDSTIVNCGVLESKDGPVVASATSTSSTSAPVQSSSPSIFSTCPFGFSTSGFFTAPKLSPFGGWKPPVTDVFSSGASATPTFSFGQPATCTSSTSSPFDAPSPLGFGPVQTPVQTSATNTSTTFSFSPAQDSSKTAFASPSLFARPDVVISPAITTPTPSPFDTPSPWGSMPAPAPTFASPSLFSDRGDFGRPDVGISPAITTPTPTGSFRFSPPFGPTPVFENTGVCAERLPGFGVNYSRYHSNPFRTNPPFAAVHAEQGSRYPRYAPTPDLDDPRFNGKLISISASNSYRHKSHEELRWEDYNNGDKGDEVPGGRRHALLFPPSYASPSLPNTSQRTTVGTTQEYMTGFPLSHTIPTAFERPHEAAGVSSPSSGCTACGATSSSSASGYLGFNVATNPPPAATSLPGLFFPTSGSHPMMFVTPNLAAQGTTTTPAVHPYSMMFGTPNLSAQGTSTTPAVHPYPTMFGTPILAAQGTTPAVQAYPMMFGTHNLAAQGTTPAFQAYPVNGFVLLPSSAMNLQ